MADNQTREKRLLLMKEAPVKKALLVLAVPSVIAMLVNALYNFVDTMFVGMLHNTEAMAGVSVGFPLFIMIMALGQLAGIGASSYVGRKLGAGEKESAERAASLAIWMGLTFSILSLVIGLTFLETILAFMGATPDIMGYATEYGKFIVIGSVFTIINMVFNNLLRTEGAARISMTTLILGAVVNIVLDPIFMFEWGLGLGVAGAAMATVIAQMCSTTYILSHYIRGKSLLKISKKSLFVRTSEDKKMVISILKIGTPVFAMQMLSSAAVGMLNTAAALYGAASLATLGISNKIYMMVLQVMQGYVQAFLPFTAFNMGAKSYRRVREGMKFSLTLLISIAVGATIIFNSIPEVFIGMFTKDEEVIRLGINCLKAQTYLLGGVACINLVNAMFQAMGKAKQAAILAIGRQGLFFIPMVIVLPKIFEKNVPGVLTQIVTYPMENGLYGVMFAQPIADLVTFVLAASLGIMTIRQIPKEDKMIEQVEEVQEIQIESQIESQTEAL